MRRTTLRPTRRRARWTWLELMLVAVAVLLIGGASAIELVRWARPPAAPAAPRADETAPAWTETPTEVSAEAPPAATDTATPAPQPSATPTLVVAEPPLTLEKTVSASVAAPGQQLIFTLLVGSGREDARTVELRDTLDEQLEILQASANTGTCGLDNPVVCSVVVSRQRPATVLITARVRPGAQPGSRLSSQALAQDDLKATAASDPIVVTVAGPTPLVQAVGPSVTPAVEPTATTPAMEPTAAPPERPAPSPAPNQEQPAPTLGQPPAEEQPAQQPPAEEQPTEAVIAAVPTTPLDVAGVAPAEQAPATPEPQAAEQPPVVEEPIPQFDPAMFASPGLPPTIIVPTMLPTQTGGPKQPGTTTPTLPSTEALPNTASTAQSFGLGFGLLGLALTLHGVRRVRRSDAQLSAQGQSFSQLQPIISDVVGMQEATVKEIGRMQQDSERMLDLLRPPDKHK